MAKRLLYILIGAASLVAVELILEGIQYTTPPDWFYPIWIVLSILFEIIAIPAHLAFEYFTMFLGLPLLVKPMFTEMGSLRVSLLLIMDALNGALLGWLFFFSKSRVRKK